MPKIGPLISSLNLFLHGLVPFQLMAILSFQSLGPNPCSTTSFLLYSISSLKANPVSSTLKIYPKSYHFSPPSLLSSGLTVISSYHISLLPVCSFSQLSIVIMKMTEKRPQNLSGIQHDASGINCGPARWLIHTQRLVCWLTEVTQRCSMSFSSSVGLPIQVPM